MTVQQLITKLNQLNTPDAEVSVLSTTVGKLNPVAGVLFPVVNVVNYGDRVFISINESLDPLAGLAK
jgi:hypothetical protein